MCKTTAAPNGKKNRKIESMSRAKDSERQQRRRRQRRPTYNKQHRNKIRKKKAKCVHKEAIKQKPLFIKRFAVFSHLELSFLFIFFAFFRFVSCFRCYSRFFFQTCVVLCDSTKHSHIMDYVHKELSSPFA